MKTLNGYNDTTEIGIYGSTKILDLLPLIEILYSRLQNFVMNCCQSLISIKGIIQNISIQLEEYFLIIVSPTFKANLQRCWKFTTKK